MSETVQNVAPHLPEVGFVRLAEVLRLIPVSKTAWFKGVSEGRFPRPVKLGRRASGYRVQDVRDLIERLSNGEGV
ncbi:MAG TPA: AlpA family phage regulatory protein [Candidatus Desulfovibrio intestinavium]|uniref:AlpA family phage regulatory protein n=1 Tax=Candidatus Desulfovibrio intestinavium TaxID=2838534 RepID=A0A9D2HL76_9BACT|nr:AlpA family phage regulatory protein [Candidatus Desulfovibrio intestinavium]